MSLDLVLTSWLTLGRRRRPGHRRHLTRRDGLGRHVRPHRRRLRPLLRRPRVARAALREDALRPGAARADLHPCRDDAQRAPLARRSSPRPSSTCCATYASPPAGSPRPRTPIPRGLTATATKACSTRGPWTRSEPCSATTPTRGARVVRHHTSRELRGSLDPQPPACPRPVGAAAVDRSRPPAPVRGPRAAAAPGAGRQGADRVERLDDLGPRRGRDAAGTAGLDRCGGRGRRLPTPRDATPRRPLVPLVARRRRSSGPARRAGRRPRRTDRRLHPAGRSNRRGAMDQRGDTGRRRAARPLLGRRPRRPVHDSDDGEQLVARQKDLFDSATPSANSLAAVALYRLAALTGEIRLRQPRRPDPAAHRECRRRGARRLLQCACRCRPAPRGITEVAVVGDRLDLVEVVSDALAPGCRAGLGRALRLTAVGGA